jgi:tRNA_anti-like
MAIIPCAECAHQVSDQAASCPSCGAPFAHAVKTKPRGKRVISRMLITLMALWTLGTLLWLLFPSGASDQLTTRAKSSPQRLDRGIEHLRAADPTQATHRTEGAPRQAAADQPSASVLPVSSQPAPALRSEYRTTAEQLYRDYAANVVATQTKIGASRVRLTGSVAEIEQDAAGRPVVKLWAGNDSTAAMTLAEDQRAAAAQLAKGEAVEIECDKLGRSGALLQGTDCTLALVDFRPKEVNLALFLANENGTTRVYVVGPMTEAVCLRRSAEISSRLEGTQRDEHVVSRNCTDAVREGIPPEGCRLSTSSMSIADEPTAHLWRYDCSSSGVARTTRRLERTPIKSPTNGTTLASTVTRATMEPNAESSGSAAARDDGRDSIAAQAMPVPVVDSVAVPPAPATSPAPTAPWVYAGIPAPAPPAAEHITTNNIRLASAVNSDTGTAVARVPSEESTVAHATQSQTKDPGSLQGASRGTISAGTTAIPDDLGRVRAADPQAADHIASYCAQTTVSNNRDAFIAECRRSEAEAWTRLVLQNEFPTLDEATRRKCSEPPFPDTYLAKESCAQYVLREMTP